jgi:hypothetical protein
MMDDVRQRRTDVRVANAVARGLNIEQVRGARLAEQYMQSMGVPAAVIERVLAPGAAVRAPSAEQAVSEAIVPTRTDPPRSR